jgi:hypothetical protein
MSEGTEEGPEVVAEAEGEPEVNVESEAEPDAEQVEGEGEAEEHEGEEEPQQEPEEDKHVSDDEHSSGAGDASSQASAQSSMKSSRELESDTGDGAVFGEAEDESIGPVFRKNFNTVKAEFIQARNQSIIIQRKLLELFPHLVLKTRQHQLGCPISHIDTKTHSTDWRSGGTNWNRRRIIIRGS